MASFNISGPSINQGISIQLTVTSVNAAKIPKRITTSYSVSMILSAPPEIPTTGQIWPLGLV